MFYVTITFESQGDYMDPSKVSWEVTDEKLHVFQRGQIAISSIRTFGPYETFQKVPQVKEDEIGKKELTNLQCKNAEHMRNLFWKNLMYWKHNTENLVIMVKGGWPVWSHWFHRIVHDDFENRKLEDLRTIIDLDMLNLCNKFLKK